MIIKKNGEKPINLGIQLLRMILAFWIVTVHCYFPRPNKYLILFYKSIRFHAPTFIFISFYLYYNQLVKKNINKITERIIRLFLPYSIWPLLVLLINNFCHLLFDFEQFKKKLGIKDYFFQIIIGRRYYSYFWYLNVLLFSSLLFTIISFISKKDFLFIVQLLGLISYKIHLSSFYKYLNKKYFVDQSIILFIEMMPTAVLGLTFSAEKLIPKMKSKYIKHIIIQISFLFFLCKLNIFKSHGGYLYQAVEMNTFGATNTFIIFCLFPFEYIKQKRIIDIIKHVSNFTGGIF